MFSIKAFNWVLNKVLQWDNVHCEYWKEKIRVVLANAFGGFKQVKYQLQHFH